MVHNMVVKNTVVRGKKIQLPLKFVIATLLLGGIYSGCQKPEICMNGIKDGFVMEEELAISLSRNTLVRRGIDVSNMVPVPYWNNSNKLFARNLYDQNSGYVLWHNLNERDRLFEYSVSITREGDNIYCSAEETL